MAIIKFTTCTLLALSALSCTRKEPAHQLDTAAPRAPSATSDSGPEEATSEGALKSPLPLLLQVEKSAGGVGLHVLQRGPEKLSLAANISAERVAAPAERVQGALTLRTACKQQGCVQLAAGGELVAPVWLGMVEGERCDALYMPSSPGEHVLRVSSCDGTRSAEVHFFWNGP